MKTVCLRFGNLYGPHSVHKKGAVTTFIKALIRGEPIVIYGDGSASRDYIHVDDLCKGIKMAIEAPVAGGDVFHLASGRETTVFELANLVRAIAGEPVDPIEFKPRRQGEVARNAASCKKAKKVLGFQTTWEIEQGLQRTWEWFVALQSQILECDTTDA